MSELTYHQNGDYLIPELELPAEPRPLGKYGRMRREYLKAHRPILYNSLVATGKLHTHLLEIEEAARSRLGQMMPELMEVNNVTEAFKDRTLIIIAHRLSSIKKVHNIFCLKDGCIAEQGKFEYLLNQNIRCCCL